VEVSDLRGEYHSPLRTDLSLEQAAVARKIIRATEQSLIHFMFLQGNAVTGKAHTVRTIVSE
jgi:hypothetical protein